MQLSYHSPIWFYPKPVDFRRQIDGLALLVADELSLNPTSGQLFVFRNRRANQLKLLWYDRNGFWLCCKRLEQGRFCFPKKHEQVMEVTRDQLSWLLSGLDFTAHRLLPDVQAKNMF